MAWEFRWLILLEIILGQIPEAIYFALFMIFAKELKRNKALFVLFMVFEYLALKHFIKFDVLFQILYTAMTYLNLKVFYKDKAIITDIFVFMGASLLLIITSILSYVPANILIKDMYLAFYVALAINRALMIILLAVLKNRLPKLYKSYRFFWNRHRNTTVKIRSLTLRNISIILFNVMFYIINICMLVAVVYGK